MFVNILLIIFNKPTLFLFLLSAHLSVLPLITVKPPEPPGVCMVGREGGLGSLRSWHIIRLPMFHLFGEQGYLDSLFLKHYTSKPSELGLKHHQNMCVSIPTEMPVYCSWSKREKFTLRHVCRSVEGSAPAVGVRSCCPAAQTLQYVDPFIAVTL